MLGVQRHLERITRGDRAIPPARKRLCLSCGYDGQPVQGDLARVAYRCPACDEDLYARPPLSYADMEDLDAPARQAEAQGWPAMRRGVAIWAACVGFFAIGALAALTALTI